MELLPTLGRLHVLLLHLPIGLFAGAALLELIRRRSSWGDQAQPFMTTLWVLCGLTSVAAAFCGWQLALEGGYHERTLFLHRWLSVSFSGLCLLIMILCLTGVNHRMKRLYGYTILLAALLLGYGGHLGGSMTHGKNYLFKYFNKHAAQGTPAPPVAAPLTPPIETPEPAPLPEPTPSFTEGPALLPEDTFLEEEMDFETMDMMGSAEPELQTIPVDYHTQIKPILNATCTECHGPEKFKGKLRLDSPSAIIGGSQNGSVIFPGSPLKSPLYNLTVLPEGHLDIMPNKGPPLTPDKTALLHEWILQGAPFGKEDPPWPTIAPKFTKAFSEAKAEPISLDTEQIISALSDLGAVIRPVPGPDNWLSANLTHCTAAEETLNQLLQLADQIADLNLSATSITDEDLTLLEGFKNLTRLNLKNTAVSNRGLPAVCSMEKLTYLNMSQTDVNDEGLRAFAALPHLRNLYLWNSKITTEGATALQELIPACTVTFETL